MVRVPGSRGAAQTLILRSDKLSVRIAAIVLVSFSKDGFSTPLNFLDIACNTHMQCCSQPGAVSALCPKWSSVISRGWHEGPLNKEDFDKLLKSTVNNDT
jgi:hypothetical protein